MLLKVGQLAKQVCLSVRTLHHYDEIGLLSPSVRTDAGHRLYNTKDISRLHRIQALKQLGIPLQKIADIIQENSQPLPDIIAQQIANLERELEQATQLKAKLIKLQENLNTAHEPDIAGWLDTLALMNVYEKYLTAEEIEELNSHAFAVKHEIDHEWPEMVKKLQAMMDKKVPADADEVTEFVILWTEKLERLVGHNPNLLLKIHFMSNETEMRIQRGISQEMTAYLGEAMSALHQKIFTKYLSPEQIQLLNKNRQKNKEDWPPLIAAIREKMQAGVDSESEEVKPLAMKWKTLFETSATGGDPDIAERLRLAYEREPLLIQGTGLDQELFTYIRQAMDGL
ncbi:MerR family transcriptional regulator [Cellvibrio zantedeschiae]|uniref:MerR family transcriptional regulator n=1 Tax=Cellvibrio zantedeschiae TaxID=1237077 RepID=A0ABQ3B7V1_9GAMM|nr:MerR family transcriptional regulator [Cellvibrio zantedeschiae]GGY78212.1 MerR family transcriptional regulator [Cellvibrio zantedeschiae]